MDVASDTCTFFVFLLMVDTGLEVIEREALGFAAFFATLILTHLGHPRTLHQNQPSPGFFIGFLGYWLLIMGVMVLNWVLSIVYCVKAALGEWARYPLLGRLAWRFCLGAHPLTV